MVLKCFNPFPLINYKYPPYAPAPMKKSNGLIISTSSFTLHMSGYVGMAKRNILIACI